VSAWRTAKSLLLTRDTPSSPWAGRLHCTVLDGRAFLVAEVANQWRNYREPHSASALHEIYSSRRRTTEPLLSRPAFLQRLHASAPYFPIWHCCCSTPRLLPVAPVHRVHRVHAGPKGIAAKLSHHPSHARRRLSDWVGLPDTDTRPRSARSACCLSTRCCLPADALLSSTSHTT
jgi:hypothetical protein